ncbi:(deoxy)nucleoside triphosphate pyrophosphohydrolase [Lysinibacillus endophyticus]|uniref:(deoxy)nucleoside triphosphate pyrophosphohydrolase n=1 Tax=Ureibacillus endophyticus TaxID=1978490 RepID=UPI003134B1BE
MKKLLHVVAAIIENDQHEIFCALRGPNMSLPNYWEFPGGKIENGETPEKALVREIKEEFDCVINVGEKVEDTTWEYEDVIVRLQTFKANIIAGVPIAMEHADARWVARDKLKKFEFAPADIPAVEKICKN